MKPKNHSSLFVRALEQLTKRSYSELFSIWISLALLFALGYFSFASIGDVSHHGPAQLVGIESHWIRFLDSLYYSIITATSTGYGDITPRGFSKALASMQSVSALFIFAIFVTKLVSHHQEIALKQVHRMTFEDVFHNIREGLFIIRQDFDGLIQKTSEHKKMDEEDWDTLIIAYKQAQNLLNEIPDFYNEDTTLYTLDARREQLLQEAVHRTMHRINHVLDTFSKNNINWQEHQPSMKEINELLRVTEKTIPLWQEKSPYQREEAFLSILKLKSDILGKIASTTG
ncbi:MAG: two pore domain potassium channel family protein [Candidatus Peribacteraceae bacterium]|nr:two pore domain potassium channel family protein [Candidatus Peribacteraceae bacterium]